MDFNENIVTDFNENIAEVSHTPIDPENAKEIAEAIAEALRAAGFPVTTAEPTKVPSSYVTIEDEAAVANMEKMLDLFDDCEDVTAVYHNWEN